MEYYTALERIELVILSVHGLLYNISFFFFGCAGSLLLCMLSLVAVSAGYYNGSVGVSHCGDLSCRREWPMQCMWNLLGPGSNPGLLHWQVNF